MTTNNHNQTEALKVAREALEQAYAQIDYLHGKFTVTGSGNAVQAQIAHALAALSATAAPQDELARAKMRGDILEADLHLAKQDIERLKAAQAAPQQEVSDAQILSAARLYLLVPDVEEQYLKDIINFGREILALGTQAHRQESEQQSVTWGKAAALTVLEQISDGPYGASDVQDALDFLNAAEMVRANLVGQPSAPAEPAVLKSLADRFAAVPHEMWQAIEVANLIREHIEGCAVAAPVVPDTAQPQGWDAEFLSKRLARVARAVGVPMPDMSHEDTAAVAGTILGQIAGKLERAAQPQEAGQTESAADLCERLRAMRLGPCNDAANFIERMAAQAAPAVPDTDAKDAERWRALIGSARIRPLGCAGIKEREASNYAHLGLELWTVFGDSLNDEQRERLAKENALGREWLTAYADIAAISAAKNPDDKRGSE